jgi:hypothetical protein
LAPGGASFRDGGGGLAAAAATFDFPFGFIAFTGFIGFSFR